MSGLLDLFQAQAAPSGPPLVAMPSTPGERFDASMAEAMSPDRYFTIAGARRDKWQETIDALHTATGQAYDNPYGAVTLKPGENDRQVRKEREQKIVDAYRALQHDSGVSAELPDPETIDQRIADEGRAVRERSGALAGTGNGIFAFAGSMLAPTPENIVGAIIPPSRAVLGATTVARGFLAGLGREALYQGAVGAGLTAATEGLDVLARKETGTAPEAGEITSNVLMGGAGGAVLGAGFHALHAGPRALWERWQGLKPQIRENAPLEVRDAMQAIEREVLFRDANRLGLPWELHERYQGNALDAIMRGRAPTLEEIAPGDTPMTALSTILRQPKGISVEGLGGAFDRVTALPDSELEPFARELKPEPFQKHDQATGQLADVRQQIARMDETAQSGGMADKETKARLQEIETELLNPKITAREQMALQGERDALAGEPRTVEPEQARKAMPKEWRDAYRDLQKREKQLAKETEKAAKEKAATIAEVRGQLDKAYGRSVPKFGDEVSAETLANEFKPFGGALEKAETTRLQRIAQEIPARAEPVTPTAQEAADAKAIEDQAKAILDSKRPLGDLRKEARAELEQHDQALRDAQAALKCAGGAGG